MNYNLAAALTSIVIAKGESILDSKDDLLRVFSASAPELAEWQNYIDTAVSCGAVMILTQAKNDDNIGQKNAANIALSILIKENGIDKEKAIELCAAFCTALGFSFGRNKTDEELLSDAEIHISRKEYDAAIKILISLDAKKIARASYMLGCIYYKGMGVEKSYKTAIYYFEKAAKKGLGDAYFILGNMQISGEGFTKSIDDAIAEWKAGAEVGDSRCEYNLAMLYMHGRGVNKDLDMTYKYLKSAAQRNFEPALKELAKLTKEHEKVSDDIIAILEKRSEDGDVKSLYLLGNCYFKGDGVPQNKSRAIDYYTEAARKGHLPSQIILINRYMLDPSIPQAWSAAYYWYIKAKKSDKKKLMSIHPAIVKGEELFMSVPKTAKNKRERYEEAAKLGYIPAYTAIAKMYRDSDKAIPYLKEAASVGDIEALELLIPRIKNTAEKQSYIKILDYVNSILEKLQ